MSVVELGTSGRAQLQRHRQAGMIPKKVLRSLSDSQARAIPAAGNLCPLHETVIAWRPRAPALWATRRSHPSNDEILARDLCSTSLMNLRWRYNDLNKSCLYIVDEARD